MSSLCYNAFRKGDSMEFKDRLRQERLRLNLTQEQLANKLNVGRSNVANWEYGRNMAPYDTLEKIANIFDCSIDYLLGKTACRNTNILSNDKVINNDYNKSNLKNNYSNKVFENILINELYNLQLLKENDSKIKERLEIIIDFLRNNQDMLLLCIKEKIDKPSFDDAKFDKLYSSIITNTNFTVSKYNQFLDEIKNSNLTNDYTNKLTYILNESFRTEINNIKKEIDKFNDLN